MTETTKQNKTHSYEEKNSALHLRQTAVSEQG